MDKINFVILFILLSFFSNAQSGVGIFAGPQMTFFQPENTSNYNQEYYKFRNPQLDYNIGIFGTLNLKNNWLLDINIGTNSKTYLLDNYYTPLPGTSSDEKYNQSISGTFLGVSIMRIISSPKWQFYPFVSLEYILNSYSEFGWSYNVSESTNDTFITNPNATNHLGYSYNSFGLKGGIVLHNQKILKRFMLRLSYAYEFSQLPSDYYNIDAQLGNNSFNSTIKWQGHFSYINFDLMFYIKRWGGA